MQGFPRPRVHAATAQQCLQCTSFFLGAAFVQPPGPVGAMAAREIIIPVRNSELGVAVSLDALPDDENDILQVLQAEQAPLRLWLDFAKAYLQQGREEQTRRMLEDGCSDGAGLCTWRFRVAVAVACSAQPSAPTEIEQYYGDSKYDRLSLLCASASFYTRQVRPHALCKGAAELLSLTVVHRAASKKTRNAETSTLTKQTALSGRRARFASRPDSA